MNVNKADTGRREGDIPGQVDGWLAELFAPDGSGATVDQIAGQAEQLTAPRRV
jgi:hypothetical protein